MESLAATLNKFSLSVENDNLGDSAKS